MIDCAMWFRARISARSRVTSRASSRLALDSAVASRACRIDALRSSRLGHGSIHFKAHFTDPPFPC